MPKMNVPAGGGVREADGPDNGAEYKGGKMMGGKMGGKSGCRAGKMPPGVAKTRRGRGAQGAYPPGRNGN